MSLATLYVTLNEDGELVLEGDLLDTGRETLKTDTGGPTEWSFDSALGVPERTLDLAFEAFVDELQAASTLRAQAIMSAVVFQRIVDER